MNGTFLGETSKLDILVMGKTQLSFIRPHSNTGNGDRRFHEATDNKDDKAGAVVLPPAVLFIRCWMEFLIFGLN